MSDIEIKGIAGFDGANFTFVSPLDLKPGDPFPETAFNDGELSIATIKAKADKEFPVGAGAADIKFGLGADGFAALGVYRKADKLLKALELEGLTGPIADLSYLPIDAGENLLALRWGYGFKASVDGKVALAAAPGLNLSFGASGQTTGFSVLLHKQKQTDSVADSIIGTLKSWRVPGQIKSTDDLHAGTTVLYETMGRLDLSLGAQYGYDFSWSRDDIKIGALSGDLKLKIEVGINAQLGFSATGRYGLVMSRPSDEEKIRFQVFRLKEKGWSFALDAGITSQFSSESLPKNIDAFIAGVFNLNGSQVFKDLQTLLSSNDDALLTDFLDKYLGDFVEEIVGVVPGIDQLADVLPKFKEMIEKWHDLPHETSSLLYGLLGKGVDLNGLSSFVSQIIDFAGDPKKIAGEITKHVEEIDFFTTPIGKWLAAYSEQGIVSLLANVDTESEKLFDLATKTKALLDGSTIEGMVKKFQESIDSKLNVSSIVDAVPANLDELNELLKKRLMDFLGKNKLIMDDLNAIHDAAVKLHKSAADFYEKGYAALMEKYKAEINYTFQKTTHKEALVDITFDFGAPNRAQAETYLAQALKGDFSEILTGRAKDGTQILCAKINKASFTHEIKRNTHLEVGLPYYRAFADHINESKATGEIVEANGKHLWVFTLKAFDVVRKKKSMSKLALDASLSEASEIRVFSQETYQTRYKFLYAVKEAKRPYLKMRYDEAINEYLADKIPSFDTFLDELGLFISGKPQQPKNFGNILTSLEIGLPGNVISVWKKIPRPLDDEFFKQMSFRVQTRLREWVRAVYLNEKTDYGKKQDIYSLLAYSALPLRQEPMVDDGIPFFHWEYQKKSMRKEAFDIHWEDTLRARILPEVRKATSNAAYADGEIDQMRKIISDDADNFIMLCKFEKETIRSIVKTIKLLFGFLDTPVGQPEPRMKALAEFGSEFTDTFNDDLGGIHYTPKGSLRPLGLILINDISNILDPALGNTFTTLFEMSVLKPEVDFDGARKIFLNEGRSPDLKDTIKQLRVLSV